MESSSQRCAGWMSIGRLSLGAICFSSLCLAVAVSWPTVQAESGSSSPRLTPGPVAILAAPDKEDSKEVERESPKEDAKANAAKDAADRPAENKAAGNAVPDNAAADRIAAPIARLEADGPLGYISALAFRRDPEQGTLQLYAAGWDKTVHLWQQPADRGEFRYRREGCLRVPIGPGYWGALNTLAISEDGRYAAVAGRATARDIAMFRDDGFVMSSTAMSEQMRTDLGQISVFDLETGRVTALRGHQGVVRMVRFPTGSSQTLVSAASETAPREQGVVRVWNVEQARQTALLEQLPKLSLRPGVAAWKDPAADRLQVAIAWGDGRFHLWDTSRPDSRSAAFVPYPVTAAIWNGSTPRVLAGGVGVLGSWALPDSAAASVSALDKNRDFRVMVNLSAAGAAAQGPLAVAYLPPTPVSRMAGAPAGFAAWVVWQNDTRESRLLLVNLATNQIPVNVPLWKGPTDPPPLAVDPTGEYLAVAGNFEHEVFVYRVADLLTGRTQPQVLRNVGLSSRGVQFVRSGNKTGLKLTPQGNLLGDRSEAGPGSSRVLDIRANQFTGPEGWELAEAASAGYRVQPRTDNGRETLQISGPAGAQATILLGAGEKLTSYAVSGPVAPLGVPLVAVAIVWQNESKLFLYRADTGAKLRELSHHIESVTGLSFSQDGRLLASTARDQTVALWWLADLNDQAHLTGGWVDLELKPIAGKRFQVVSDPRRRFLPGDEIVSVSTVADNQAPLPFDTLLGLNRFLSERKPGETVTVRIRRGTPSQEQTLSIPIDRAVEERKPLSALFMTARAGRPQPLFVAWDPLGRYDVSHPDAEQNLAWLFNTGDPAQPTRYAAVDQYREQNLHAGLLQAHLEQGPRLQPKPAPVPTVSLLLRDGDRTVLPYEEGAPYVVRNLGARLSLFVQSFPLDKIARVTWTTADAERQPLEPVSDGAWETRLPDGLLSRGVREFIVTVETGERQPRTFSTTAAVRWVPEAPQIELSEIPDVVREEQLRIDLKARSPLFANGEKIRIEYEHLAHGKSIAKQELIAADDKPQAIMLALQPGENQLSLLAVNESATDDTRAAETMRRTVRVRLPAPQRPELNLTAVRFPDEKQPLDWGTQRTLTVDRPVIDLIGVATVTAPEVIASASWQRGEEPQEKLSSLPKEAVARFEFQQRVTLQPGDNPLRVQIKTARGLTDQAVAQVRFVPRLPVVEKTELLLEKGTWPANDQLVQGVHDPRGRARIVLAPRDQMGQVTASFEALLKLTRGDKIEEIPLKVELTDRPVEVVHELDFSAPQQTVELVLKNEWGAVRKIKLGQTTYRRPPQIVELTAPEKTEQRDIELTAIILSATRPTETVVQAAGLEIAADRVAVEQLSEADKTWKLTARVPVDVSSKRTAIRLQVSNADGPALQVASREIEYLPPPPPLAEVQLDLEREVRSAEPVLSVPFQVRSTTPVESITLIASSGGKRLWQRDIAVKPNPAGAETVPAQKPAAAAPTRYLEQIDLADQDERLWDLQIEVRNAGGNRRTDPVSIHFVPAPLGVVIDRLAPLDADARPLRSRGYLIQKFEPSPSGRLSISGHLEGMKSDRRPGWIKIWVNGFLQSTPPIDVNGRFQGQLALNLPNANRVVFELPHAPLDEQRLPTLLLDCSSHLNPPRLHLLLVILEQPRGKPSAASARILRQRAMSALGKRHGGPANPFQVISYPSDAGGESALSGDFTREQVHNILLGIGQSMRQGPLPSNDVLVMYYCGTERVTERDGEFELVSGNPRSNITRSGLTNLLGNLPGAHLLLLDVKREGPSQPDTWPRDDRLGLLRVVWNSPQANLPDNVLLISTLDEAVEPKPQAEVSWGRALQKLEQAFAQIRNEHPVLVFAPQIPDDLQRMLLSR